MLALRLGCIAALVLVPSLSRGATSQAEPDTAPLRRPAHRSIEVQALTYAQMLPRHMFGVDAAWVLGTEQFQLRVGAVVAAARPFDIGAYEVTNVMEAGQLDVCAAKQVQRHRIRMCIGGQGGAWQHRWEGQRVEWDVTPWAAGTLESDYRIEVSRRVGILFGVGVTVPVVGPQFQGNDELGRSSPLVFVGPVAGSLTLGAAFRLL